MTKNLNKTLTGDGISILINCQPIPLHSTLAFASWHSLQKNLPDAQVAIACNIEPHPWESFGWIYRGKVRFFYHRSDADLYRLMELKFPKSEIRLVISPYVVAVREYSGEMGPVTAKSEQAATLVNYEGGCGEFVVSEWIDKPVISLQRATNTFKADNMTINEVKVLSVLESCWQMYVAMQ